MPRIHESIQTIYVSASRDRTEADLLTRVTALIPNWQPHAILDSDIPLDEPTLEVELASPHDTAGLHPSNEPVSTDTAPKLNSPSNDLQKSQLTEAFAFIRRQRQQRVVIFIDQFEQWLFANGADYAGDLVGALRQCDGQYLQCVLLVRDDFWGKVTRFFNAIDVPLLLDDNWTLLDLFDQAHARDVLRRFGVAYEKFPANPALMTPEQNRFLDQAIQSLTVENRVVCVQLALFAESLKGQPWDQSLETSDEEGGELELNFFRRTFDAEQTPRRMRVHAEGASRVLQLLLPEAGEVIKDVLRSEQELFEATGYQDPKMFRELIDILDHELHLITPSELSDELSFGLPLQESSETESGYQLTHDFLIKPLQDWLQFRSLASPEGKARLRLSEFTMLYRSVPRAQSLPTLLDYLSILYHTRGFPRTANQQTMMLAAKQHHQRRASKWLVAAVVLIATMLGTGMWIKREARDATNRATMIALLGAELPEAISIARKSRDNRDVVVRCEQMYRDPQVTLEIRVRAALVCLPSHGETAASTLVDYVLIAPAQQVVQLAQLDEFPFDSVRDRLWTRWQRPDISREQRLRVACLLANDPKSVTAIQSETDARRIVQCLISEDSTWAEIWATGLYAIRTSLLEQLLDSFADPNRESDQLASVHLISRFYGDEPERLIAIIPFARPRELSVLYEAIKGTDAHVSRKGLEAIRQQLRSPEVKINVDEPWGSPWWCIGDRKPIHLDPMSIESSESFEHEVPSNWRAVVSDHCCLMHQVPIGQLDQAISMLDRYGFSIAEISIEKSGAMATAFVSALRDGTSRRWAIELTAEALRAQNQKHRNDGYVPSSVIAYGDRFTAVWFKPPAGCAVLDGDMYVEVHEDRHEIEGWKRLLNQGIGLPRANAVMRRSDGARYFTSVRWKTDRQVGYDDVWDGTVDPSHIGLAALNTLKTPIENRIGQNENLDDEHARRTAIWWNSVPVQSTQSGYQSLDDHQQYAATKIEQGFYPMAIHSKVLLGEKMPRYHSIWWAPRGDFEHWVEQGKRNANLNLVRFLLGDHEGVVDSFTTNSNPDDVLADTEKHAAEQAAIIAGFSEVGLPVTWLVETLCDDQADICVRRNCGKALALYPLQTVDPLALGAALSSIQETYQRAYDPCLRSTLQCLAQRWQWQLPESTLPIGRESVSSAEDRFITIHTPKETWIGSAADEPGRDGVKEGPAHVRIDRSFAIASHEVTIAQFKRFRPEHVYGADYASDDHCPVVGVTLYDAMQYCRWLSEQEGISEEEMCYPAIDQIRPDMRLDRGFADRKGYRLPTAVEWEYACRGGLPNSRWFGFDPERLDEYAWTAQNSGYRLHPVGKLLPNDYGLFDMLGNAMEWCHATNAAYASQPAVVQADLGKECLSIANNVSMQTRGGAMLYQPLDARASQVNAHQPNSQRVYLSFRICKTVGD